MCIIIAKKAGVEPLDMGYFERAWDHNGDGGGIVWKKPTDDGAYIQKGFMKKEEMMEKIKEINQKDTSFIAHFRIRSVGDVKPENTHPFVMDKVTFAHNGTIHNITPEDGKTDSETFGLMFLKNRSMKWIKDNAKLLELALGSSKFAIMDNITGEIFILNKQNGKEQDGAWFSNSSADKPLPTQYSPASYNWTKYDYYNDNEFDFGDKNTIKARKFFGTKSYTEESFIQWSKENDCWIYSSSKYPKSTFPFSNDVVVGRNGLYKLNKILRPRDCEDYADHIYKHKDPAYRILGTAQRDLQRHLSEYWKMTFESKADRDDYERDLSMENLVLDAARRFVADGKELNFDTLWDFIINNLTLSEFAKNEYSKQEADYMIDIANGYIGLMFGYMM